MDRRLAPKVIAVIAIAGFFVAAAVRTGNPTLPNFGDVGKALSAVGLAVAAYEWFLWRWIPLPGRPARLGGTWKMRLEPQEGPQGASLGPEDCYLEIRQTASTIRASLLFGDGESKATTASLADVGNDKRLLLFYDYEPNKPTDVNPRRKGAASLKISPKRLRGKYWNDFAIRGELTSNGRCRNRYETWEDAVTGTYS